MKISNNFAIGNLNNSFKVKQTKTIKPETQQVEQPKIDAQYYRANYGIAFKGQNQEAEISNLYIPLYDKNGELKQLNVFIPNGENKVLPLQIKDLDLGFVVDAQGDVDAKKLNMYSTIFKRFFIEKQEEMYKLAHFYETFPDDIEEKFGEQFGFQEEVIDTDGMTDEEIAEFCPQGRDGGMGRMREEYTELAKKYRKAAKYENVVPSAMLKSRSYLFLMNDLGIDDMSFVDENEKMNNKISDLQNEKCGNRFNLARKLVITSRQYKNKYDMQFMNRIVDIMKEVSIGYNESDFDETVNIMQDVLSIDKENEDKVYDGFLKFIKKYQMVDEYSKNIFMNVFNPVTKKYDEKALELLNNIITETIDVTFSDKIMENNSFQDSSYAEQEIIREYFEYLRDEKTGEITKETPNVTIFAEARVSKYLNI